MKNEKVTAKVLSVETIGHSYYGNPTKSVSFETESGTYMRGKTALNAACAYGIGYYSAGRKYVISYHFTRKGTLIIDSMDEVKNN